MQTRKDNDQDIVSVVLFGDENERNQFVSDLVYEDGKLHFSGVETINVEIDGIMYHIWNATGSECEKNIKNCYVKSHDAFILFDRKNLINKRRFMIDYNSASLTPNNCLKEIAEFKNIFFTIAPVIKLLVAGQYTLPSLKTDLFTQVISYIFKDQNPGSPFSNLPKEVTHMIAEKYIQLKFCNKDTFFHFFTSEENRKYLFDKINNKQIEKSKMYNLNIGK